MDTSRSFVGRGPETVVLGEAWRSTQAGDPRVVSVTGAPGTGKTRLVEHFLAGLPGASTLWLAADENEVDRQWEILRQAVARLPSSATAESIRTPDPGANPVFVGDALATDLQRAGPTVVVVDDAHWADRASIEAIRYAARRMPSAPVLVVVIHHPPGAVRRIPDGRPNPGLPDGWRRMVESDRGVELELGGLAPDELMQLAALEGRAGLSPAGAARLWQLTDGNPLHVRHLLPQLSMRTLAADSSPLPAPHSISATIASQLATCHAPARELVSAAAVLGERFRLADAAAIAELAGGPLTAATTEALAVGLIVEVPGSGGREFVFADRLTRSSLYHDRALSYRQELHRRAARLGGPNVLDHRLTAAAGGLDAELADDAEHAARERWRRGELTAAAALYRHAVELTPRGPVRAARVLTTVEALLVAGDAAGAQDYESDVGTAPDGPWRDYVAGYQLLLSGRIPEAKTLLDRALATVREPDPTAGALAGQPTAGDLQARPDGGALAGQPTAGDLQARIAAQLAIIAILTLDYRDMIRYGVEAVEAPATEPWVAAYAHFARAIGLALSGRAEEAIAALADADAPGAAGALDALCARGMIALWTDRLADADRDLRQSVARATAGEALRIGQALGYLAEVEYRRGELTDAVLHAELALGDAEESLRVWEYAILHALACYPRAARAEWSAADAHVRAAAHWAGLIGASTGLAYAAGGLAAIAQAKDDPTALLAAAVDIEKHYDSQEPGTHLFGPLRADALAQLGRPDDADAALATYLSKLARPERRSARLGVARVRARIALARGAHREALTACTEALALATEIGLPLEVVRINLLTGRCLAALDRRAPAVAALRTALLQSRALGATAYVTQAADAARTLGLSIETPEAVFAGLTATELSIARLIGARRTNKQIAVELSLSVKTVEGHLTAIYRKLGVDGRGELRALAAR
ncbi:helix-turn-helix transcriptional regulator [Cryptosporangium aurantiacum]|uniref:Regulatory protein, luxR family n=1 Tax=Cryptosporangium aurantiacum TaxID=134849 RepID=A0A1M7JHM3_9ACTN|nr:AAA family ATPase [Cryptosporangium aurantiacum]SHM52579.1 regulatory protein, luxR family [Cryptosporangium aurantiacum]